MSRVMKIAEIRGAIVDDGARSARVEVVGSYTIALPDAEEIAEMDDAELEKYLQEAMDEQASYGTVIVSTSRRP